MRLRTGFSFRTAAGKLDEVMSRLVELGATYAPITDRASTFGFYRWAKMAEKKGLIPVFGVELAVSPDTQAKKPASDHWTFIALGDDVSKINRLVETATEQFRYQPLLTIAQAIEAEELAKMTGHRPVLNWDKGPVGGIHIALGPSSPIGLIRKARDNGWPLMATHDNVYPRPEDKGFYEILLGRDADSQTYPQFILSDEEWRESVAKHALDEDTLGAALEARNAAWVGGSRAKLRKASLPTPVRRASLRDLCLEGAAKLGCDLSRPEYAARLDRELQLISEKGYEDYFYIVTDIVQWAREKMIVGPARGSSCGSLVCYLLRITTIDPIPYGLIFERFVDINRTDMPDIDIDFSDQQRHLVFEYINQVYGDDRSARLGTVNLYQPRSALREAGAALKIPPWKTAKVAETLIERSSGDARAMDTLLDSLTDMPAGQDLIRDHPEAMIMARFEGHPSHLGQHAAGVVIADEPIINYVAIDRRTGATMCDKKDAEEGYNLLKIDALGLTQLSVFEDCLAMAGLPRDYLETVPLDDPEAFRILQERRWAGIFQFNGMALQDLASRVKVDCFEDISAITALARPGPLASGGAGHWVDRKNGEPISYPHEAFRPYMEDTFGVVMFQEQVMQIGREVGGLSWEDVTLLRKAMSKSLGKEYFYQFGDRWKPGAIEKGVSKEVANKVWDDLCAYGSWSFNKSHSVAYAILSYWCCYLKAHFPFEFGAATLTHEKQVGKQIVLLRELVKEGYEYVPVDPDHSTDKWGAVTRADGTRVLVGPLSNVKGLGPKSVSTILAAREAKKQGEPRERQEIPPGIMKKLQTAETPLDSLFPVQDRVKVIMPDPRTRNIYTPIIPISEIEKKERGTPFVIIGVILTINIRDLNETVYVAKRGGQIITGKPTKWLNMRIEDDSGVAFCHIDRYEYERLAKPIIDRGRTGKSIYAIRGSLNPKINLVSVSEVRYIGDMEVDPVDEPEKVAS
jgi:DNA polymerase III alpha subunit